MFKLVAIDVDGTLLNSRGELSGGVIAALREYEQKGGTVVLASGRSPMGMIPYIKEIGLKSKYHIAMMGNQIFSLEKEYPVSFAFNKEEYKKIVDRMDFLEIPYMVSTPHKIYYKRFEGHMVYEYYTHGGGLDMTYTKDIENIQYPYRINAYAPDKNKNEALYNSDFNGVQKYSSGGYVDIIPGCAHKGYALSTVLYALGIEKKDSMAIGDGAIDAEMLSCSGLGIAVGNSQKYLLEHADVVMDKTNDEDAVAYAVYHYALK